MWYMTLLGLKSDPDFNCLELKRVIFCPGSDIIGKLLQSLAPSKKPHILVE